MNVYANIWYWGEAQPMRVFLLASSLKKGHGLKILGLEILFKSFFKLPCWTLNPTEIQASVSSIRAAGMWYINYSTRSLTEGPVLFLWRW